MQLDAKTRAWFERNGLKPPEHVSHDLTPDDISKKVERPTLTNWRQEGNCLIADTDFGPLVNHIPTNKLLVGTDKEGLPIFRDI